MREADAENASDAGDSSLPARFLEARRETVRLLDRVRLALVNYREGVVVTTRDIIVLADVRRLLWEAEDFLQD